MAHVAIYAIRCRNVCASLWRVQQTVLAVLNDMIQAEMSRFGIEKAR